MLLILIPTAWLVAMACSVSLCRAAADGDHARAGSKDHGLAAASGDVVVEERSGLSALLHAGVTRRARLSR